MLNVTLADSGACQLIYGHPWNCLSDAWRGWLTNSGRVNKSRRSDKRWSEAKADTKKEGEGESESAGGRGKKERERERALRMDEKNESPRKRGRHLLICPQDTGPDTNYFIWWHRRLSDCLSHWWTYRCMFSIIQSIQSFHSVNLT